MEIRILLQIHPPVFRDRPDIRQSAVSFPVICFGDLSSSLQPRAIIPRSRCSCLYKLQQNSLKHQISAFTIESRHIELTINIDSLVSRSRCSERGVDYVLLPIPVFEGAVLKIGSEPQRYPVSGPEPYRDNGGYSLCPAKMSRP